MTRTLLQYTEDTYRFESDAKVTKVDQDETGRFVETDQTIFYPQGGGQPSDTGTIQSNNGSVFTVSKALKNGDTVRHYGVFEGDSFGQDDSVSLVINESQRIINAINHSAGHLLAFIVEATYPDCKATKGYHFEEGPYVEFTDLPTDLDVQTIEQQVKAKILASIPIIHHNLDSTDGSDYRVMRIEGVGQVGCGGTHIRNTGEIPTFTIRKVKKGKISYTTK
jgi:Ser-tRNA(Ala) deacylase AlaX